MNLAPHWHKHGQAVFIGVLFLVLLSSLVVKGIVSPLVHQVEEAGDFNRSQPSYYAAESGSEDATYRLKKNLQISPSYNLTVGSSTASVEVTGSGNTRTVVSQGDYQNSVRTQQANLTLNTNNAQFFYGVQVGDGGLQMNNNSKIVGNVYSNGDIGGNNNPVITGTAVVAGGISDTPSVESSTQSADQFFGNGQVQVDEGSLVQTSNQTFASTTATRDIAQSFTPSSNGPLNHVWVYLAKVGSPGNITLRINADNASKPSTSSLTNVTINASSVSTTAGWVDVALSSPPTLVAGTKYWIVLDYSTNSTTNYWNWRKDPTDAYANNTGKFTSDYSSGSAVWVNVGGDLAFRIGLGEVRDLAQSFTANVSDRLNKVSVYLGKIGSPGNLTLRINTDNGGKPANTGSLVTATIDANTVGVTPSWVDVAFVSPPNLTAGTKYWIVLDYSTNSTTNYWNWRKDPTDAYVNNTGRATADWSTSSALWTNVGGDLAFRVWLGGINTKIDGVTIGDANSGLGRANIISNSTIHGSACPNQYCVVDNPPRAEMPIAEGVIEDWRTQARAGGACVTPTCNSSGTLDLSGSQTLSLGPAHITGNLNISNNAILTVTGTILVDGNVTLSNNCQIKLASSYGANSGIIVTDGNVNVSNNCAFQGSGQAGSYLMLVADKNSPSTNVMDINNGSTGIIYYAPRGRINFSNNSNAREATAYGINMSNGAVVTYDSGLANINFSSGPGATFDITGWQEL